MYQGRQQELNNPELGEEDPTQLYKYGPSGYGGADTIIKSPYFQSRRRRLNLVAIFICLFVPWLLFCFMFWLTSFQMFYRKPALCFFIAFLALVFVIMLGVKAVEALKNSRESDGSLYEPTWYVFLFITALFAWVLGIYCGYHNFYYRMEAYYGLQNLGNYAGVDPHTTPGQQLMDGGRVVFQPGTHLDLARSMSFRNNDLYCVVPIVRSNCSNCMDAPETYDFWAVGVNCCCGDTVRAANFQCGEYKNNQASAGLRLMKDEERPFYRLAVQQAVGAYGIKSNHPLFFHWVSDPVAATESYRWEGHRQYLIGVYLHFAFQLLCVCLTTCAFSRMGDEDK